jgi:hypothetical protein
VQEQILGVVMGDGTAIAFPVADARWEIAINGGEVTLGGVTLVPDGGGFRAVLSDGSDVPSHQAFWFAWSQFHPDTMLWGPGD